VNFKVLFQHLHVRNEEKRVKFSQYSEANPSHPAFIYLSDLSRLCNGSNDKYLYSFNTNARAFSSFSVEMKKRAYSAIFRHQLIVIHSARKLHIILQLLIFLL
jgi:hypothetical protein